MIKTAFKLSSIGILSLALFACSSTGPSTDGLDDLPPPDQISTANIDAKPAVDDTKTSGLGDNAEIQSQNNDSASPQSSVGAGTKTSANGSADTDSNFTALLANYSPHNDTYYFQFDSSVLDADAMKRLEILTAYLAKHPSAKVLLAGNTDERGSREYNVALGERRAKTIGETLRVAGIADSQIRMISYGQEKPVALSHNESAWRLNRRVDLSYEAIG